MSNDDRIEVNRMWLSKISKAIKYNDAEKLEMFAEFIDLLVEGKEKDIKISERNGLLNKSLVID